MASDPSEAMRLLGGLVLESGDRWGEVAVPVQVADAEAVLDCGSDDPRNHFWTRPRGMSKTTDLGGIGLVAVLTQLPPGGRAYAVAADRDQGALLVDSVAGFRDRTPGLVGALTVDSFKVTANRTGATLTVLAADASGSWGLRPHFLVVDELAQWQATRGPKQLWTALHSATGKNHARLVALTSAGDPAHWAYKVLEHARVSAEWRTSETPGPVPWASERWLAEQAAMLLPWEYARLHLNEWTGADDRLASLDDLRQCVTLDGPLMAEPGRKYVIGVDIGLTNDATVCTVCHAETIAGGDQPAGGGPAPMGERERMLNRLQRLGAISQFDLEGRLHRSPAVALPARTVRIVVDRQMVWQGRRGAAVNLGEVASWVLEAHRAFNGAEVVFDPFQAVAMAQALRERGVKVTEFVFSSSSVGRLAVTMHTLIRDHALALPDDPELLDELANVRLRETSPGVVRMDHDAGRHDDRAISVALAAHHLLLKPPELPWTSIRYRNDALRRTR